jgi:ATP-dependent Clp protease ATP-binding subunit ClpA
MDSIATGRRRHQKHINHMLTRASSRAQRLGSPVVGCEHVMLVLLDGLNEAGFLLRYYGLNEKNVVYSLDGMQESTSIVYGKDEVTYGDALRNVVARVRRYASAHDRLFISSMVWLDAMLKQNSATPVLMALHNLRINHERLRLEVMGGLIGSQVSHVPIPGSRSANCAQPSGPDRTSLRRILVQW